MTGAGSIKALALDLDLDCHIRVMTLYEVTIGVASICLRDEIYYIVAVYISYVG